MKKLLTIVCTLSSVLLFGCNNENLFTPNDFENYEEIMESVNVTETVVTGTEEFVYAHELMESFKTSFESTLPNGKVEFRMYDKGEKTSTTTWNEVSIFCYISDDDIRNLATKYNDPKSMRVLENITVTYYEMIREKLDVKSPNISLHVETYDGDHTFYAYYSDSEIIVNFID